MTSKRHLGIVDDYGNKYSATSAALSQSAGPRWLTAAPASIGARLIPARHISARPRRRSHAGSVLAIDAAAETNKNSIEAVKLN